MEISDWIALGTFALGVVGGVAFWLLGMDRRLVKLETQIEPLWKDVAFASAHQAAAVLHSPENELGLDEFIDMWRKGTLDATAAQEFRRRLERVAASEASPGQRQAADIMLRTLARETR